MYNVIEIKSIGNFALRDIYCTIIRSHHLKWLVGQLHNI